MQRVIGIHLEEKLNSNIKGVLAELGFNLSSFDDKSAALEKIGELGQDCLLVLIEIPSTADGADEYIEIIKDVKKTVDAPFLFLTPTDEIAEKIVEEVYNEDFIIKPPFDLEKIEVRLGTLLDNRVVALEEYKLLLSSFLEESENQFYQMEELIGFLQNDLEDEASIDGLFRIVHTVKGSSGLLDLKDLESYAHTFEDYLSVFKKGEEKLTSDAVDLFFDGIDVIRQLLNCLKTGAAIDIDLEKAKAPFKIKKSANSKSNESKTKSSKTSTNKSVDTLDHEKDTHIVTNEQLDKFMELGGELAVIRNTMRNIVSSIEQHEGEELEDIGLLKDTFKGMEKISNQIQTEMLSLRKTALKTVFKSLPRTVRDLNKKTDKKVELVIEGSEIMADKSITQALNNILIHMVRNSMDHGISKRAENEKIKGKFDGTLTIRAYEKGDNIVVEVGDDGKGLPKDLIIKKAIDKELCRPEDIEKLTDQEIYQYIFDPSFSTAEKVSNISGRGVGMDMVKTTVLSLNGKVSIDSAPNQGTTFSLEFPTPKSISITNSFIFKAGEFTVAVPMEFVKYIGTEHVEVANQKPYIKVAGELHFVWSLEHLIDNRRNQVAADSEQFILLVEYKGEVCGFVVDECLGQLDIVIRPFEPLLKSYFCFKGSAILDRAQMSLVIDPEELIKLFYRQDLSVRYVKQPPQMSLSSI